MAFRNFAVKNQIMEILHPHPKCVNSSQQFSYCLYTEWQEELSSALTSLAKLFADEHTVAAYEIQSSGIIGTLLSGLISEETAGVTKKLFTERANTFRKAFSQYPQRFVLTKICMIFFCSFCYGVVGNTYKMRKQRAIILAGRLMTDVPKLAQNTL